MRPSLVAISVPDLTESVRWYVETLAFRVVKQMAYPDYGVSLAILERDDFRLELIQLDGSAPAASLVPGIDNPALIQGIGKLAFTVADLDDWAARLKGMGVRFQVPTREDPEDGTRSFIVLDKSGNWLQFTTAREGGRTEGRMSEARQESVEGRVAAPDGVEISYTVRGTGGTALVLIHGGLADRSFWAPQLADLSDRYRVVALDLAGHGDSGRSRKTWTIPGWAEDVQALVTKLDLKRVVLVGNSLGGPVALEAARLLPGRVLGVVGVDTFHDLTRVLDAEAARAGAERFRRDFLGSCRAMVSSLFHPGKEAELRVWAEKRMCATAPEVAVGMMEGWAGYDLVAVCRAASVPVRAINGDLWPTLTEVNRAVVPEFDVRILAGAGHYPMLERPEAFNHALIETVGALERDHDTRPGPLPDPS